MYEKKIPKDHNCGIVVTMEVIGGKWKPCLINWINKDVKRPSELAKLYKETSRRVIQRQLSELESQGIVYKKIYQEYPLKSEYYLTKLGKSLIPLIDALRTWGNTHKEEVYPENGS